MHWTVRLRGGGTLEVEAVGTGDAEGWLERTAGRIWPELALSVTAIEMLDPEEERIARRFRVRYAARATLEAQADDAAGARREALRAARTRLADTALSRLEWTDVQTGGPR